MPYFLAWHRGYLYYFEQELRKMYPALTVPYWDYYKYPRIPSEFTDPATGNPLYVSRTGTNVYNALTLAPFASTVINLQRGTSNAFETSIESQPHNPVHNLIGGEMANMTSPRDPIFFCIIAILTGFGMPGCALAEKTFLIRVTPITHRLAMPIGPGHSEMGRP